MPLSFPTGLGTSLAVGFLAVSLLGGTGNAATPVTLTSSPDLSVLGLPVVLTATVPPAATGRVTFYGGITVLGSAPVSSGTASLTTTAIPAGVRHLTAFYSGDANNSPGISNVPLQTVNAVPGSSLVAWNGWGGYQPLGAVTANFDGARQTEVAYIDTDGEVVIGLGNPSGVVQTVANVSAPRAILTGDYNGDGKPDLAVAGSAANSVSVLLGKGDGTFLPASVYTAGNQPVAMAQADFNGDGKFDFVTLNQADNTFSILLGSGDGSFQSPLIYPIGGSPLSLVVADLNHDGKADLVIGTGDNTIRVFLGNGDGTFQPAILTSVTTLPVGIATGDLNNDGAADLVIAGGTTVSVLLGRGNGMFQSPVISTAGSSNQSVAIGDFNGDGKPDWAVASFNDSTIYVFLGDAAGGYQSQAAYPAFGAPDFLSAVSIYGDGRQGLLVSNYSSVVETMAGAVPTTVTASPASVTVELTPGKTVQVPVSITTVPSGVPLQSGIWDITNQQGGSMGWLSPSLESANSPTTLNLTISPQDSMSPGAYAAWFTVPSPGGSTTVPLSILVSGCGFSISPTGASFGASGGTGSIAVAGSSTCSWTALSDVPQWITLGNSGGALTLGSGTLSFTVAANPDPSPRTGLIIAGGQVFTVSQVGAGTCTFSMSPASVNITGSATPSAPATGSFTVIADSCTAQNPWTVQSEAPWVTIANPTGNGAAPSTTVTFTAWGNPSTSQRSTMVYGAGTGVEITQAGSTEPVQNRVVRALYQAILGRDADPAGYSFWTGSGAPLDPATGAVAVNIMADDFYRSPEFQSTGWKVLSIYQVVIGSVGYYQWTTSLGLVRSGTVTTDQLISGFSSSLSDAAFVNQVVENAYGRPATAVDTSQFQASGSRAQYLDTVVFPSSAFQNLTNPLWVDLLYYTILTRDPDTSGFNFWLAEANHPPGGPGIYYVSSGSSYAAKLEILGVAVPPNPNDIGFLGSPEFQALFQ